VAAATAWMLEPIICTGEAPGLAAGGEAARSTGARTLMPSADIEAEWPMPGLTCGGEVVRTTVVATWVSGRNEAGTVAEDCLIGIGDIGRADPRLAACGGGDNGLAGVGEVVR